MPKSEKTIGLDLENLLLGVLPKEAVEFLGRWRVKLESANKNIKSDITTIEIGSGSAIVIGDWIYFGGIDATDSWRVGIESGKWVGQFWTGAAYESRGGFTQ